MSTVTSVDAPNKKLFSETNGTFVNGVQLQPNVPQVIQIGDTIRFSTLEFKVDP